MKVKQHKLSSMKNENLTLKSSLKSTVDFPIIPSMFMVYNHINALKPRNNWLHEGVEQVHFRDV
jgi:hypothetical protein